MTAESGTRKGEFKMAKNYTIKEAVEVIVAGKDLEAITDLGRRYPVLIAKVAALGAIAGEKFVEFMGYMPEYLTANKVNTAIKNGIQESDGSDEETTEETTEDDGADDADDTEEGKDYDSMSAKVLWDILGKAGKRKLAKSTKKADLVVACKAMDSNEDAEEDTESEYDAEETEANPYEGKSAMDLFKECKKRGIKAASKKPAKFYADLLTKADEDDTEEGWDDTEEVEEEAPKEKAKAKAAGKTKPVAKAAKKEEAEDEDWDI